MDFDYREFKRVLLQTPSGFAIFNVCEYVFTGPHEVLVPHLVMDNLFSFFFGAVQMINESSN